MNVLSAMSFSRGQIQLQQMVVPASAGDIYDSSSTATPTCMLWLCCGCGCWLCLPDAEPAIIDLDLEAQLRETFCSRGGIRISLR